MNTEKTLAGWRQSNRFRLLPMETCYMLYSTSHFSCADKVVSYERLYFWYKIAVEHKIIKISAFNKIYYIEVYCIAHSPKKHFYHLLRPFHTTLLVNAPFLCIVYLHTHTQCLRQFKGTLSSLILFKIRNGYALLTVQYWLYHLYCCFLYCQSVSV